MTNRTPTRKPVSRKRRLIRGKTRKRSDSTRRMTDREISLFRRKLIVTLSVLFCIEGVTAVFTSPWFQVHRMEVRGVSGLMPDEISTAQKLFSVAPETNFFRVHTVNFASQLGRLPFVQNVTLTRHFPDTLEAKLTVRQPIAIIERNGESFEVDPTGVAIRLARPELAARLPHIVAPAGTALGLGGVSGNVSVNTAVQVIGQLNTISRNETQNFGVAKIDIDSSGNLCLNMKDEMRVFLGSPDDMATKLEKLGRLYRDSPDVATRLSVVNLTVPEYPACVLRSVAQG